MDSRLDTNRFLSITFCTCLTNHFYFLFSTVKYKRGKGDNSLVIIIAELCQMNIVVQILGSKRQGHVKELDMLANPFGFCLTVLQREKGYKVKTAYASCNLRQRLF